MKRKDMIEELTANEIEWLVDNFDKHSFVDAYEFFSAGGFTTWTDEELAKKYEQVFSNDEVTND